MSADIRRSLIAALQFANAMEHIPPKRAAAFIAGTDALEIASLDLDSLARMELLITLETEHGVVITPDELASHDSIAAIAATIDNAAQRTAAASHQARPTTAATAPQALPHTTNADLPDCVRLYRRAYSGGGSINQLNKLHIDMDDRLMPGEVETLQQWHAAGQLVSAAPDAEATITAWLSNTTRWVAASGKRRPEPYARSRIAPAVLYFQGPGARQDKMLLICFTTRGRRMMIPHAALLQHFDAHAVDVVIVADTRRSSFASGVPLLGDTLPDVFRWLHQHLPIADYRSARAMGCSGGGYAAAIAPKFLPIDLGVSVAGRFPAGQHHIRTGMIVRAWRAAIGNRAGHTLMVFGADKTRDRKFAKWIARAVGGQLLATETPKNEVGHMVLYTILEQGGLTEFFFHAVLADLEAIKSRSQVETRCFPRVPTVSKD